VQEQFEELKAKGSSQPGLSRVDLARLARGDITVTSHAKPRPEVVLAAADPDTKALAAKIQAEWMAKLGLDGADEGWVATVDADHGVDSDESAGEPSKHG